MEVSYHAAKRFLQRVKKLEKLTHEEIINTQKLLYELVKNLKPLNVSGYCPLPNYSKKFLIAYNENTITTILPKEYVKSERLYYSKKISKKEYKKLTKEI